MAMPVVHAPEAWSAGGNVGLLNPDVRDEPFTAQWLRLRTGTDASCF